jgi:ABC-2 type transport system ATP-binding protein
MTASLPVPQDAIPHAPDGVTDEAFEAPVTPVAPKAPPAARPPVQKKPRKPRAQRPAAQPGPPPPLPADLVAAAARPAETEMDIPPRPPLPVVAAAAAVVAEPEPVVEAEPEPVLGAEPEPVVEAEPEPAIEPEPEPDPVLVIEDAQSPVPRDVADPFAASVVMDTPVSAVEAQPALVLRGVTKTFGDTRAVDGIDLTVPAGTFYGLVGPNGAGKTTTLSMIAGLLRPDKGAIRVGNLDAASHRAGAKRAMGVLPDRLRTFDRLTGRQLLYYYGVLRRLPSATVESRIADLARAFDLTDALGRSVSDYSAGMTKKVMLAGAMIHSPRLLVLDEPFESVDPVSSAVILDILSAYVAHGGTVILSSHGMEFVERVCSRVAVMVAGQVLAEGTIDEVRGELTLEQRFIELAGGLSDVEGLEWLHTFSD